MKDEKTSAFWKWPWAQAKQKKKKTKEKARTRKCRFSGGRVDEVPLAPVIWISHPGQSRGYVPKWITVGYLSHFQCLLNTENYPQGWQASSDSSFFGCVVKVSLIWVCWKFDMARMDVANWAVTALFRSSNSFFFVFCEVTQIVERELTWKRRWGGETTKQPWTYSRRLCIIQTRYSNTALRTDVVCQWEMVQPSCCVAAVVE